MIHDCWLCVETREGDYVAYRRINKKSLALAESIKEGDIINIKGIGAIRVDDVERKSTRTIYTTIISA